MSHSTYLSDWYWEEMYNQFVVSNNSEPGIKSILQNYNSTEEARNDLLMLYVYYSDISYTYIYESPAWTVISLLSNMGGQLGNFYFFYYLY